MIREYRWGCVVLSALGILAWGIVNAQDAGEAGVIVPEEMQRDAAVNGDLTAKAATKEAAVEDGESVQKLAKEGLGAEEGAAPATEEAPVAEAAVEEAPVAAAEEKPAEAAAEEKPAEPAPVAAAEEKPAEPAPEAAAEEKPAEPVPAATAEEKPAEPVPVAAAEEKPAEPVPAAAAGSVDESAELAIKEAVKEGIPKPPEVPARGATVAKEPMDPLTASMTVINESEVLKRTAFERHARDLTTEAEKDLKEKKYYEAIVLFEEAMKTYQQIPVRPGDQIERQRTKRGLAEAYYRHSLSMDEDRFFDKAKEFATKASGYGHPKAAELLAKIQKDELKPPPEPPRGKPPVWTEKDRIETGKQISTLITDGIQYMQVGDFDKARETFEKVMKRDPYNTEAIRMLHKIGQKKLDRAVMEREALRKNMMADVVKSWNPRDYAIDEGFEQEDPSKRPPVPTVDPKRDKIRKKMEAIMIPEIDFHQANINDVIGLLRQWSVEYDTSGAEGKDRGINMILNLRMPGGAVAPPPAAPAAGEDAFGGEAGGAGEAANASGGIAPITFSARYISLLEALNIVTKVAGLKYRIEGSVVMVIPLNFPEGELITKMYDVLPTLIDKINATTTDIAAGAPAGGGAGVGEFNAIEGATLATERGDLKEFFAEFGVKWPEGSKIKHMPSIAKLNIVNTADNIAVFEGVLAVLNVVPSQIEIESRFVEVRETDFDSLGFEWLLNADWNLLQKKGQENLPMNQRERIRMNGNAGTGGFTAGNRYLPTAVEIPGQTTVGVADSLVTLTSVLTDPQLSMVLHALEQKGNADLLSAPKVTTQSGTEATIKVVTEYIYPTEYTVTPITGTDANGNNTILGGIVEPGAFETREVGVILQVLPEMSSDGSMINLTMTPQVVSEPQWHNYGSEYNDGTRIQNFKMEMPFFHTRTVTTAISIYNGATVVMGGMITENRNDVEDKIPFLGDIPLIGRLFRSKVEHSTKNNLLIFVTARQVDPAGRVLKRQTVPNPSAKPVSPK